MAAMSRVVVLGGGGLTGIAWETGVIAGLLDEGVDLREADVVIGTSAGAFAGAALAAGADPDALYDAQVAGRVDEPRGIRTSRRTLLRWWWALRSGGDDPAAVGRKFAAVARRVAPLAPAEVRRAVIRARLLDGAATSFPPTLRVTAIDARSGALTVFDASSGVSLEEAVAASGAVPGVWAPEVIGGVTYIDGGMASGTNAALARDAGRVVVLAPLPRSFGKLPGPAEEVESLRAAGSDALLLVPDEASAAAIGPNWYDPDRRAGTVAAGRAQGRASAADVARTWR
jgi:NTE family protein